ncbi:MAG TPA: pyridoxal phosphate-dependent aminotransferase, partial [Miltoncostaeaceae bacterium]|nr:pyridoxal phosphate-dependent aminotransferase [Miltoncostaeaceae bacterium]
GEIPGGATGAGGPAVARRMAGIAPFEVMEVLNLAQRLQADGHDVIHLEVGEPDFGTPAPVLRAAAHALRSAPMTYTPALGLPALRDAIAAMYGDRFGVAVDPARVVVTTGSSAALLLALGVLADPGDQVLVGDPGYPCNRHFARFVGAEPVLVPTGADTAFQLSAARVREAWTPATRAVIAASPSNPTGTLIPRAEWRGMAEVCRERGAALIADEIYAGLVYGRTPETVLALADDVFVVNSFSKYFGMTGWRVGWLVAPPAYVREIEKLAQNLFICPPTPAQHAALAALAPETTALLEERRVVLHRRRDVLLDALPATGFRVPAVPEGAFYVYCDVAGIAPDSFALAHDLLRRAHVALTPGRDFGVAAPERHVRIAYTQDAARLQEAVDRIARAVG